MDQRISQDIGNFIEYFSLIWFTESKIQEATEKISECKNELSQAKRIRKNRQGNGLDSL